MLLAENRMLIHFYEIGQNIEYGNVRIKGRTKSECFLITIYVQENFQYMGWLTAKSYKEEEYQLYFGLLAKQALIIQNCS